MKDPAPSSPPIATLHTPEELLATARELMNSGNPKMYRGAILEAQAALESFVHKTIFPALTARYGKDFSDWLEARTMMDFDSRLSVLAPLATSAPVSKDSSMWSLHKRARELRKGVVHGNKRVGPSDVDKVIQNTANWMAYLGRTIELENALLELKTWVESQPNMVIQSARETEQIVADFFSRSKAANTTLNRTFIIDGREHEADAILEFGNQRVLIETKLHTYRKHVNGGLQNALYHVDALRRVSNIPRACIVLFAAWGDGEISPHVKKHADGEVFSVEIRIRYKPPGPTLGSSRR